MDESHASPARRKRLLFRALMQRPGLTIMPGGFSPVYARVAQMAGFECFFAAGSQMSAFLLGAPDTGVIGLRDVADHARHIAARCEIPVLLDGDTGFGNAANAYFAVREIIGSGVAAMSLEDQEAPKKSGTSAGRRCVSAAEMIGKLQAGAAARDELDPSFSIVARCDLLGAEGGSFEAAYERCIAYAREGRADVVWLNSAQSLEQLEKLCADCPAPVLAIWGGRQPGPSFDELERTGLKIALYPTIAAAAGLQAAWRLLNDLRVRGAPALADWRRDVAASPYGAIDLATITDSALVRELERRFMPADGQRDYETTWGHGSGPDRKAGDDDDGQAGGEKAPG